MSQVRQLDLSGININQIPTRKPRQGVQKQKFQINPGPTIVVESRSCISFKLLIIILFVFLIAGSILSFATSTSSTSSANTYLKTEPYKQLTQNLRKIIRMQCTHDTATHCTTKYEGGEYVVHIKNCVVYDFNGIPFTDVFKDSQNNWHVPPSDDMTLIVNKACNDLTATYDTDIKYRKTYAVKNGMGTRLNKIIWIPTKNCYTEFNLVIGNQNILEGTPATMITQEKLNTVVAYIYEVKGGAEGSISVSGKGCQVPIHVYSQKS